MAWVLVFHVIGFVFWMAGLLVLTQVLDLHAREPSPEARTTLSRLETRLLDGITHPGAVITLASGVIFVVLRPEYLHQNWLRAKLVLVAALVIVDLSVASRTRALVAGNGEMGRRWGRAMHAAASLIFVGVLVLAILKPL
jgi:putative membrane protein